MKKIKRYILMIVGIVGAVLLSSCSGDEWAAAGNTTSDQSVTRRLVEHEVSVSIDTPSSRVGYTPQGGGALQLSWDASEAIGVYIKQTNGNIIYAGTMTSTGAANDRGTRRFYGKITEKLDGEQYIYLHPALSGETQGTTAKGTIDYTTQRGSLSSTAHLNNLIPLVWREGNYHPENQGYALHLTLTMQENPGAISAITLHTMSQGDGGTTEDRIFPKVFKATNLLNSVNSTLPSAKTSGLILGAEDYTDAISLVPAAGQTFTATHEDDVWKVDAYIAATSIKNLDVFRTKYNVEVTAANGTFYNEYRSLPGQQEQGISSLDMLANGKCYNLNTTMSQNVSYTVVNDTYKVYSLLGMWNQYGKPYDPFGYIVYEGGEAALPADGVIPQQLKDNKDAILTRYQNNPSGTPTWLGAGSGTLYDVTANAYSNNLRQDNVIINNIEIRQPTEVFVTFISEFGWNENLLGYYHYSGLDPESSFGVRKMLIFPNFSKPNHQPFNLGGTGTGSTTTPANIGSPEQAPLREFETVKLLYTDASGYCSTIFPTGTIIGFMMMIDTEAQEQTPNAGYNLLKWSQWRLFTNTFWNTENTRANGAAADWPTSPGYNRWNYFCSGDVCSNESGTPIPGLAIYGVKDKGDNKENTAYGAMIFMVSTSDPNAMETWNKAYFNIGTGNRVVAKP